METLGFVRGKYSTVPIPGAEVTLNSGDLLTKAASEKEALLVQLRETLEQTSRKSQLERKAEESSNLNNTLNNVPLTIYIG
jgi:C4-type Zn-finger protein